MLATNPSRIGSFCPLYAPIAFSACSTSAFDFANVRAYGMLCARAVTLASTAQSSATAGAPIFGIRRFPGFFLKAGVPIDPLEANRAGHLALRRPASAA